MLLRLIELVIISGIFLFVITQIAYPCIVGTALFPMFTKTKKLTDELNKARQDLVNKKLEEEIENTKKEKGR